MAGYLTGALLPTLLVVHLLAAPALARHAPAGAGAVPGVEIMYTAPTNDGPSPANGHGNQPSPHTAQDSALNGDPSVAAAASEARAALSQSRCHCDHGHPAAMGESHLDNAGDGEALPQASVTKTKPLP